MVVADSVFSGVQGVLHHRFAQDALRAFDTDEQRAERALSIENLKNEITRLAGHLNADNHRFLVLIAEFDRLPKKFPTGKFPRKRQLLNRRGQRAALMRSVCSPKASSSKALPR